MAEASDRIPRLDVLRAVAVLGVFAFHYSNAVQRPLTAAAAGGWDAPLAAFFLNAATVGASGVALFFVLSGFCIHLAFLRHGDRFRVSKFLQRRFLRIYPAYFVSLIVFSLLGVFKVIGTINLKQFLTHLLLVHDCFNLPILFGINGVYWSLAIEFQFYLLYPLLLFGRRRMGLKACLFYALLACLLIQVAAMLWPAFGNFDQVRFCVGRTLGTWCDWILGACLAEASVARRRFFIGAPFWAVASLGLLLLVRESDGGTFEFRFLLESFVAAVLMEIYLGWSRALLGIERLLIPVGLISYSVYLWHQPWLKAFLPALHALLPVRMTTPGELLFFPPVDLPFLQPAFHRLLFLHRKAAARLAETPVLRSARGVKTEGVAGQSLQASHRAGFSFAFCTVLYGFE